MKPLATAIGIAVVIATIAISSIFFLRSCSRIPVDEAGRGADATVKAANDAVTLARRIYDGLAKRLNLQPEIKIDRETEIAFDRAVLQLTTVKRDFTHEYIWEQKWAGSLKRIKLKGNFTASAGFDLNEHFYINIHSQDLKVDLSFPQPRLLACELNDYRAEEEDGWWNKLTPEERHVAVNEMIESAKHSMQGNKGLQDEAKRMLELQVAGVIVRNGGVLGYANETPFIQPVR